MHLNVSLWLIEIPTQSNCKSNQNDKHHTKDKHLDSPCRYIIWIFQFQSENELQIIIT